MFEVTDSHTTTETAATGVLDYIQTVYSGSKNIKYKSDYFAAKLFEAPEQPITPAHVSLIASLLAEQEERLTQLLEVKTNLQIETQGIQQILAEPQATYAELVADGDIAAADFWQANRNQLRVRQQVIQDQLAGFEDAETILKNNVSTYKVMHDYASKAILLEAYHEKMQQFNETFDVIKADYLACDAMASKIWGGNVSKREHRNTLLLLANIQPELNREYAAGIYKGGMDAELMVVDRIVKGKKPFVNPDAANLMVEKRPNLAKLISVPEKPYEATKSLV